jgi:hypothetical protein
MSLEFETTDDLLEELFKRTTHAIFIGIVPRTSETEHVVRRGKGDPHITAGLAADMSYRSIQALANHETNEES